MKILATVFFRSVPLLPLVMALAGPAEAAPPAAPYKAVYLYARDEDAVLVAENEHLRWQPASMVKMMTVLIAMEAVREGKISLEDLVPISQHASEMGGSQIFAKPGERYLLGELLRAVTMASANDAAVAVAEAVAGSEEAFIARMNVRAKELNLADTTYSTVHGLPPGAGKEPDLSSAHDLAMLARELSSFREVAEWASTREAPIGDDRKLTNTNLLLWTFPGADGLKTGSSGAAGFNVTATAVRNDFPLIAVILGATSRPGCFQEASKLLTRGFDGFQVVRVVAPGAKVGAEISVSGGTERFFTGVASKPLTMVVTKEDAKQLQVEVRVPAQVSAPVAKDAVVGAVLVMKGSEEVARVDVIAPRPIERSSWLPALW